MTKIYLTQAGAEEVKIGFQVCLRAQNTSKNTHRTLGAAVPYSGTWVVAETFTE